MPGGTPKVGGALLVAALALGVVDARAEAPKTTPKREAMAAQRAQVSEQRVKHGERQALANRVKAKRAEAAKRNAAKAETPNPERTKGTP